MNQPCLFTLARHALTLFGVAATLLCLDLARAQPLAAPEEKDKSKAGGNVTCVQVRAQARYRGYGYDHIVELRNECPKPALCSVKTDVNPAAVEQSVPAGETRELVTFRGSPASAFTPTVSCKVDG